jgi:competence protein ComEC
MQAHGLAIALRTPAGRTFLVDAGGKLDAYDAGRDTIAPWLKARGVERIDGLVLSHPDHDHYAGAAHLFENFKVDRLLDGGLEGESVHKDFRKLRKEVTKRGGKYEVVAAGDALSWDPSLKVDVLSPPKGGLTPPAAEEKNRNNENSLVIRVQHGKNVFLFPGDIQHRGRDYLLANRRSDTLKTTVLVAPHHGFSHGKKFVEAAKPEVVVVSCLSEYPGKEIVSPGKEAKAFYGAAGARVYVTAFDGTVEITSDGNSTSIQAPAR